MGRTVFEWDILLRTQFCVQRYKKFLRYASFRKEICGIRGILHKSSAIMRKSDSITTKKNVTSHTFLICQPLAGEFGTHAYQIYYGCTMRSKMEHVLSRPNSPLLYILFRCLLIAGRCVPKSIAICSCVNQRVSSFSCTSN